MRRTITVDGNRPDGVRGDVVIAGRGRDLVTPFASAAVVAAAVDLRLRADFVSDQSVKEISSDPTDDGLQALVGLPSRRGFRRAAAERLGRDNDGSIEMAILDDVPIVTSLSRMALHRRGAVSLDPSDPKYLGNRGSGGTKASWGTSQVACAGWAPDATMTRRRREGVFEPLSEGYRSPPVARPDDPEGWHGVDVLPPDGFRRWRRTDVWRSGSDRELICADGWWRDTYVDPSGDQIIVHEYSVAVTVDAATMVVLSCEARSHVLPAGECNRAALSAGRLVGLPLADVGPWVRAELSGETTCTHLNDELRSIGDLPALVRLLP